MKHIISILILITVGQTVFAQAQLRFDKFYVDREKRAPLQLKNKIVALRTQIASKKWSFKVGYTTAMDRSLFQLAGLKAPQNLKQSMQTQNMKSQRMLKIVPKLTPAQSKKLKYFFSLRKWDWRKGGKVSPVRNQGGCGSCWAFATIGAFEGSDRVVNSRQIDASEQCVLNCSGKGSCRGGWWAFDFLINKGVALESRYPYTATDKPCNNSITKPYRAVAWGYVNGMNPTVSQIKNALLRYGPLAVAVHVSPSFQAYTGGVFNNNVNNSVNHGVTLIGWDDSKRAWIIKNSWGTGWGSTAGYGSERGYMYIGYGCSKIGYAAAWVKSKALPKPRKEDCISFNPARLSVKYIRGRWKIVEGNKWLKDFGAKRGEALKALAIMKHYRMNQMCFVGRPKPSIEYYLVNGKAPIGAFRGEDAIRFNPNNIRVKYIRGDWKIVDGNSWLFSFGRKKEDAYFTYNIIKKYKFTYSCFVGRPNPSMKYFRR